MEKLLFSTFTINLNIDIYVHKTSVFRDLCVGRLLESVSLGNSSKAGCLIKFAAGKCISKSFNRFIPA